MIFDKKETTTPHSKAIGVQARTLEIYEQIDLADKLIGQGKIVAKARMVVGGAARSFMVLLRPDNYIGLISEDVSDAGLREYLKKE